MDLPTEINEIIFTRLVETTTDPMDIEGFLSYAQGDDTIVGSMSRKEWFYRTRQTITPQLDLLLHWLVLSDRPSMDDHIDRINSVLSRVDKKADKVALLERLFHMACIHRKTTVIQSVRWLALKSMPKSQWKRKFVFDKLYRPKKKWQFALHRVADMSTLTTSDIGWFHVQLSYAIDDDLDIKGIIRGHDKALELIRYIATIEINFRHTLGTLKIVGHLDDLEMVRYFYDLVVLEVYSIKHQMFNTFFFYRNPWHLHQAFEEFLVRVINLLFGRQSVLGDVNAYAFFMYLLDQIKKKVVDETHLKRVIFFNDFVDALKFWKTSHGGYEFKEEDLSMCKRTYSTQCGKFLLEHCSPSCRFDFVSSFVQPFSQIEHSYSIMSMQMINHLKIENTFYGSLLPTMVQSIRQTKDHALCASFLEMADHLLRPHKHAQHFDFWQETLTSFHVFVSKEMQLSTRHSNLLDELLLRFMH